jgi:hypothetical protein
MTLPTVRYARPGRRTRRLEAWPLFGAALMVVIAACSSRPQSTPSPPTATASPAPLRPATLPAEFASASWSLDPSFEAPTAASTELHILVEEGACASGRSALGRMSAPLIHATAEAVTITIGVRPLAGPQDCQGNPGTPIVVRLVEPLGNRTLVDGGSAQPPAPTQTP